MSSAADRASSFQEMEKMADGTRDSIIAKRGKKRVIERVRVVRR